MALIKSLPTEVSNVRVAIHWHPAAEEFTVRTYRDGKYNDSETYFTDDKEDALATQASIIAKINSDEKPEDDVTAETLDLSDSRLKGDGVAAARWEIVENDQPYGVIRKPKASPGLLSLREVIATLSSHNGLGRKCTIEHGRTDGWLVTFTTGDIYDITAV